MGITSNCTKFLFYSKSLGVNFEKILMLGRQQLYVKEKDIISYSNKFKIPVNNTIDLTKKDNYAEPLFEILGAKEVDSMDFSSYEKATIIHDLNNSIPENLKNKYDLIFDGGTLEHVFNFPIAIKNCMDALKPGGHFISITPANNLCGHGLYQFSPELFFSIFNRKNGFETKLLFIGIEALDGDKDWYEVSNPKDVKDRVTLCNESPTYMLTLAQKITLTEIDRLDVQQSDYANVWNEFNSVQLDTQFKSKGSLRAIYKQVIPKFIRDLVYRTKHRSMHSEKKVLGLGVVKSNFFRKVNI
jgi:SAM-dependent methyltransferase